MPLVELPDVDWHNGSQGWIGALIGAAAALVVMLVTLWQARRFAERATNDARRALEDQLSAERDQRRHERLVDAAGAFVGALYAYLREANAYLHRQPGPWKPSESMKAADDHGVNAWFRLGLDLLGDYPEFHATLGFARMSLTARLDNAARNTGSPRREAFEACADDMSRFSRMFSAWIAVPDDRQVIEDNLRVLYPAPDLAQRPPDGTGSEGETPD